MSEIRVLFVQSQAFFGSDSMIHSLLMQYLDRGRVEVHVACNQGKAGEKSASLKALEKIEGIKIRRTEFGPSIHGESVSEAARLLWESGPSGLASLAGLVSYAKKNRIQIVHGTEKPRDSFYGHLLARAIGARSVTHVHVKVEDWISPLVRWAMKHNDGLIGVSDFVAKSAVAAGYDAAKTHFVLNSIDARRWNPDLDGSEVRREFGIAPGTPVLSIISRLFPWKGHSDLLRALQIVKAQNPNFRLLVVGEDDPRATPGGGSYLAQIKSLSAELGLSDNVTFTGFRSDIANLLAGTDIYTMPTFEEPCAVAFLEAMAMAKPVIALESGGTPQLVEHGKSGLLSLPKDNEALAKNILSLLSDPERRLEMGRYARQRVEQYYNPQRMADEVEGVYRRMLHLPQPVARPPARVVGEASSSL
ncbi:MAG TPA: glycosyltransferase family 4 protein [Polyangiaceae bacterium]|nr:glycosyltransferase family 4 protein [Polyangiaceae bacterium]